MMLGSVLLCSVDGNADDGTSHDDCGAPMLYDCQAALHRTYRVFIPFGVKRPQIPIIIVFIIVQMG
jgi:hypothetical protein